VIFEQSTNFGATWSIVIPMCNVFTTSGCPSTWVSTGESRYSSLDLNGQWRRYTIGLTTTGIVRYRWRLERWLPSAYAASWAVTNIYIGNECNGGCGGHGYCVSGTCVCDSNAVYNGSVCVVTNAPTELRETFESPLSSSNWLAGDNGAPATSSCGTLAAGQSMFFTGAGGRRLETIDLNTVNASVVTFYIQLGYSSSIAGKTLSCSSPNEIASGVVLAYSNDGGMTYTTLGSFNYNSFQNSSEIVYNISGTAAQTTSTRFMLWQPMNSGTSLDVWVRDVVRGIVYCFSIRCMSFVVVSIYELSNTLYTDKYICACLCAERRQLLCWASCAAAAIDAVCQLHDEQRHDRSQSVCV
jgi:reelin